MTINSSKTAVVEMRGISKRFAGVVANEQVNFDVQAGEIHALLGENGAGKTTLMNILCGLYEPDEGEIYLEEKQVRFHSPRDAIVSGIGMVHQHFMLVDSLSVSDNLVLGETSGILRESTQKLHHRIQSLSDNYNLQINPAAEVWQLSVGEQQRVEILKAIYRSAKVLILDEPTAVLTPQEVEGLLETLQSLAARGTAIIFITHKLNEVLAICDRVTVLRDGKNIGTVLTSETTEHDLAQMMVGREISEGVKKDNYLKPTIQESILTNNNLFIHDLWVENDRGLPALRGIDLAVSGGEIVGIAGVDGNGQKELEEAIVGLRKVKKGAIKIKSIIAHIPLDRYAMGLIADFPLSDNLVLRDIDKSPFNIRGLLQPKAIINYALDSIKRFAIRTSSVQTMAGNLSGGNAQRVILARELSREHHMILAAQPTRGLDINGIEYIHQKLIESRDAGVAILLISTELDEILKLCDRIAVLYEGEIFDIVDAKHADVQKIGLMMAGIKTIKF
ncbi:MAG TPA: ABC transporter ATP-binding protein [Leptolyngbyaceae cyanobacterium]